MRRLCSSVQLTGRAMDAYHYWGLSLMPSYQTFRRTVLGLLHFYFFLVLHPDSGPLEVVAPLRASRPGQPELAILAINTFRKDRSLR